MTHWNSYHSRGSVSKYKARKVEIDGEKFDSKKEYSRWCQLKILEKAGEIADLERQVKYILIPSQKGEDGKVIERECSYVADFCYRISGTADTVVEDVKGYKEGTAYAVFVIKRKLMLYIYGIRVKEV